MTVVDFAIEVNSLSYRDEISFSYASNWQAEIDAEMLKCFNKKLKTMRIPYITKTKVDFLLVIK